MKYNLESEQEINLGWAKKYETQSSSDNFKNIVVQLQPISSW